MPEKYLITMRPARLTDKPAVLEWDKAIWEGEDYIPFVFDEWVADPHGRFMVAEYDGQVVGLGKLTRLEDEDWWLEGLRVNPAFEGHGIAGQIYDEMLRLWKELGRGAVRMMTMNTRYPVHHLSEQRGFHKIGAYTFYRAPTAFADGEHAPAEDTPTLPFRPLGTDDLHDATALAQANPAAALVGPLMDMGWQWGLPRRSYIEKAQQRGQAWWWRGRRGLLVYHLDHDEGEPERPFIELLAAPPEDIIPLLLDLRRLAAAQGFATLEWTVHAHPDLISSLLAAGFEHIYGDEEVWAYEKGDR
jgi:GNAT superfamily N-acetyltransferase